MPALPTIFAALMAEVFTAMLITLAVGLFGHRKDVLSDIRIVAFSEKRRENFYIAFFRMLSSSWAWWRFVSFFILIVGYAVVAAYSIPAIAESVARYGWTGEGPGSDTAGFFAALNIPLILLVFYNFFEISEAFLDALHDVARSDPFWFKPWGEPRKPLFTKIIRAESRVDWVFRIAIFFGGWYVFAQYAADPFFHLFDSKGWYYFAVTISLPALLIGYILVLVFLYEPLFVIMSPVMKGKPMKEPPIPDPRRKRQPSESSVKVEMTKDGEREDFRFEIQQFTKTHSLELPKLTLQDLEHEGWWREWRKRVHREAQQRTLGEQKSIVDAFNGLRQSYLQWLNDEILFQNKLTELQRARQSGALTELELEVQKDALEAKRAEHRRTKAEHEAAIKTLGNPPQRSALEQKQEELAVAQIDAQIQKLKNPTKSLTPEERHEIKFKGLKDLDAWWTATQAKEMTPAEREAKQAYYESSRLAFMDGEKI